VGVIVTLLEIGYTTVNVITITLHELFYFTAFFEACNYFFLKDVSSEARIAVRNLLTIFTKIQSSEMPLIRYVYEETHLKITIAYT